MLVAIAAGLEDEREALAVLAAQRPLALAGSGVTDELAAGVGARRLVGDPVTEAERLAGLGVRCRAERARRER